MGVERDSRSVDGDLCVYGATAGGIVAAVRAARLGLTTVLVSFAEVPGGVFPSLGAVETHYEGNRAPLLTEIQERIRDYYKQTYGEESAQYQTCRFAKAPMTTFEPHVAERILASLIADEKLLTLYAPYTIEAAEVSGRSVKGVRFSMGAREEPLIVRAGTYLDASYTGDLVAACGVPCRVGRESRQEFGEPHAGRLFTRWVWGKFPADAAEGRLALHAKSTTLGIMSGSSGEGDDNIMAYSYRLCLTDDPTNMVTPPAPSRYNREDYLGITETPDVSEKKRYALHHRWITKTLPEMIASDHLFHGHALPNNKRSWNATNFPGAGKSYPTAGLTERDEISRRHMDHALGILYFLQNDTAVPDDIRVQARKWGLAADEFPYNNNLPLQLYVREARRMEGRAVFCEHDAIQVAAYGRPPIHPDSVGITDFPIDSLACTTDRMPGSVNDGQYFLQEISRPGQIPFGVLLAKDVDNLLGPGAASITHVAWGTIRQTPTFMHMCEAAAHAVALAVAERVAVAAVRIDRLQRRLAEAGIMLTFFNDVDMAADEPWVPALQFFGARGFFPTFDAQAGRPLDGNTAQVWIDAASRIQEAGESIGRGDTERVAASVYAGDGSEPIDRPQFVELAYRAGLRFPRGARLESDRVTGGSVTGAGTGVMGAGAKSEQSAASRPSALTRGAACLLLYEAIE